MGKRNRKKRRQRGKQNRWGSIGVGWPENRQISIPKKKKKNKHPKFVYIEDPTIPDRLAQCWGLGKIVIGARGKDGAVALFEIDPVNK